MYCRSCGAEVADHAAVCIKCGVAVGAGTSFCPGCGEPTNPGAAVCVKCGASLAKKAEKKNEALPSSTGNWFLTLFVICIPLVGLIMTCVWAFGNTQDISKKNWAKAQLIWLLVFILAAVLLTLVFGINIFSILIQQYL